eukprot:6208295-Pleurochrysis_carterae.AAC.4
MIKSHLICANAGKADKIKNVAFCEGPHCQLRGWTAVLCSRKWLLPVWGPDVWDDVLARSTRKRRLSYSVSLAVHVCHAEPRRSAALWLGCTFSDPNS